MIVYVRKSFDEIPAMALSFFHTVNGDGKLNPLLVIFRILTDLRMCFSEGDLKLQKQRASCRQTQTRR